MSIPPLIAHRGRYVPLPENVIPSLQALPAWCDGVEIDVRLTSDSVPVLMHDSTVDRTTSGSGAVDSFTLAQIQALDAGGGAQVPTLAQYLDAVVARNAAAPEGQRPISVILVDMIGDTVGVSEAYAVVDAHALRDLCLFTFRFDVSTAGAEALRLLDATIPIATFSEVSPDTADPLLADMADLDATIAYTGGQNWLTNPDLLGVVRGAGFELGVTTAILAAAVPARDAQVDGVVSSNMDKLGWWYAPLPAEQRATVTEVIAGSHTPTFEARLLTEFQTSGDPTGQDLPILGGDVTYDGTADVWASLELTTAGKDPDTGRSLRPRRVSDLLAPYGNEVWVRRGLDIGSEIVWVPLGFFRIVTPEQDNSPFGPIRLSCQDRMRGIIRAELVAPRVYLATTTVGDLVADLVGDVYPDALVGFDDDTMLAAIGRQIVVEQDRYAALRDVADSYGKIMYWDGLGILRIEDPPDPDEIVWEVRAGRGGVLIRADDAMSDEDSFNAMVVDGQGVSGLVSAARGVAIDVGVNSPTRFNGPYGQRPEFFDSPLVLSEAQAQAAAVAKLRRNIGMTHTASFQTVVNPLLRPWQTIRTQLRDGSRDRHVVQRYVVPLVARAPASGTTREQTRVDVRAVRI